MALAEEAFGEDYGSDGDRLEEGAAVSDFASLGIAQESRDRIQGSGSFSADAGIASKSDGENSHYRRFPIPGVEMVRKLPAEERGDQ